MCLSAVPREVRIHNPWSMWRGSQVVARQHRTPSLFYALNAVKCSQSCGNGSNASMFRHRVPTLQDTWLQARSSKKQTSWPDCAGVRCDPSELSEHELERVTRKLVQVCLCLWAPQLQPAAELCSMGGVGNQEMSSVNAHFGPASNSEEVMLARETRRMHVRAGAAACDGPNAGHPRAGDQRGQSRHELLV